MEGVWILTLVFWTLKPYFNGIKLEFFCWKLYDLIHFQHSCLIIHCQLLSSIAAMQVYNPRDFLRIDFMTRLRKTMAILLNEARLVQREGAVSGCHITNHNTGILYNSIGYENVIMSPNKLLYCQACYLLANGVTQ